MDEDDVTHGTFADDSNDGGSRKRRKEKDFDNKPANFIPAGLRFQFNGGDPFFVPQTMEGVHGVVVGGQESVLLGESVVDGDDGYEELDGEGRVEEPAVIVHYEGELLGGGSFGEVDPGPRVGGRVDDDLGEDQLPKSGANKATVSSAGTQIGGTLLHLLAGRSLHEVFVDELVMDIQNSSMSIDSRQMLPPPPGTFVDREELIQHVADFAIDQGYVVSIKQSKRDRVVIIGCDRGGVYRNRRKSAEESSGELIRKRKSGSRLTNCPFEVVGKRDEGLWVLTIKNGTHNHEPFNDISEHPSARRFSEKEVLLIKDMTDAGLKPRQILKRLRQTNPELLSTPKHVYNVKAKIRQGNMNVRSYKTMKPKESSRRTEYLGVIEPSWKHQAPSRLLNLIGGKFVDSQSFASVDVVNPATQELISQFPLTTNEEFKAAVFAAKRAYLSWRSTPISTRQRIMFKFQELIRRDIDKLVMSVTMEHGKILKDSYDDVLRGLEVVEQACGLASLQVGDFVSNLSNGVDMYSTREPLGVCAGICSFEFPAMIPLWIFTIAITYGNTFILKPSEKVPGTCVMLGELAMEAGLPNGVLNIVHGADDIVDAICDDDDIKAVSFFGPNVVGAYVYARASAKAKRVQCNIGAKALAVVMPDANIDATLNALVSAGFGGAGQKCVALNTVVFVGSLTQWEEKLVERAKSVHVTAGLEADSDLGPVISKQVKEQLCSLVETSVHCGARLILDGRDILVPGYENGNFIGPTILSNVTVDMDCYREELFGPVLLCLQAGTIGEAINLVNGNRCISGASIFTTSASAARKFQTEVESGHVGINVPVSLPLPFSSFIGCKPSFAGDLNFDGKSGIQFYTQVKTVTRQWRDFASLSEDLLSQPLINADDVHPEVAR